MKPCVSLSPGHSSSITVERYHVTLQKLVDDEPGDETLRAEIIEIERLRELFRASATELAGVR